MGLDFYGTYLRGRIETFPDEAAPGKRGQDGTFYELWVESTNDPNVEKALKCLAYVNSITVNIGMAMNSKVALTLTPPFEEGIDLINSDMLQWGIGHLLVTVGYTRLGTGSEQTSIEFGGLIQKPDVKIGRDIQITINALGVGYSLDLCYPSEIEDYGVVSPATAVEKCLKKHEARSDISLLPRKDNGEIDEKALYPDFTAEDRKTHSFFRPVKISNAADGTSGDQHEGIYQGPKSDWWFIFEMCRKHNLDLVVIDRVVQIRCPDKWKAASPKMIFTVKGAIDPAAPVPIYPILEFSSPTAAVWITRGMGKLIMADYSEDGQAKTEQLDESKAQQTRTGSEGSGAYSPDAKSETGADASAGASFPGSPFTAAREEALAEFKNVNGKVGIRCEITTLGIPHLYPGAVVQVTGLGSKFDALYGVLEVEHRIGQGGFVTKFTGLSNAFPLNFAQAMDSKGPVNDKPIEVKPSSRDVSSARGGDREMVEPRSDYG